MMRDYQPIPDRDTFSIGQRRALTRQCADIRTVIHRIKEDPRSYRLRQDALVAFMDLAISQRDYGAMRLALAMWERLPLDVRQAIEARGEELRTPVEQARQATDADLYWRLDHSYEPHPLPADATPKMRRAHEQWEGRQCALDQAYRNELRHRLYPHLTLVAANDAPVRPPTPDIYDRLNEELAPQRPLLERAIHVLRRERAEQALHAARDGRDRSGE